MKPAVEIEDEIVCLTTRIQTSVFYRRRKADRGQFLGVERPPADKTDAAILRDIMSARQRLMELAKAIKDDRR